MKAVAFVQPLIAHVERYMKADNILVGDSKKDIVASCGNTRILVRRGSLAFMVNDGSKLSIMALNDQKHGDILVRRGKQEIKLRVGEMLTVESSANSTRDGEWTGDRMAVRNSNSFKMTDGSAANICEFSIPYAISTFKVIKDLRTSNDRQQRNTYARVLKNAMVLHTLGMKRGKYTVRNTAPSIEKANDEEKLASSKI